MFTHCRRTRWAHWGVVLTVATATVSAIGCTRTKTAQTSKEAEQLLEKAAAAYRGLSSFSERTTIRRSIESAETVTEVTQTRFHYRQPNMIYYESTGTNRLMRVCDGTRLFTYAPATQKYLETDAPVDLGTFFRRVPFANPGLNELALLAGRQPEGVLSNLRLGKVARVEGVTTRPVSGDVVSLARTGQDKVKARQTLWIDTKTYMIRRSRVVLERDSETTCWDETMHEVKMDPDLSADEFKWSPPPGATRTPRRARPSLPPPQRP